VTIQLDYSRDTSHFFDAPDRRAVLQLAANTLGSALGDQLEAIQPAGSNTWSAVFDDPSTGAEMAMANLTVPADTIIVFVGARSLGGPEAGFGGPGGFQASGTQDWLDTVEARGQAGALSPVPTDFGPWGGSIAFDSGGTNWYFGTTTSTLGTNQLDFYTVALHELGHVLGIGDNPLGQPTSWSRYVLGNVFDGPHATAANAGQFVPLSPDQAHWAQSTFSGGQTPVMVPTLLQGVRRQFTPLDFAGLADVGWDIQLQGGSVQFSSATYQVTTGSGAATIAVTRPAGGGPASVQFTTAVGSAVPNLDYTPVSGTVVFPSGATTETFTVPILNDPAIGPTRTVALRLFNPVGATIAGSPLATLSIVAPARPPAPTFGDFDGDGKADLAVYRPTTAQWLILQSTAGPRIATFGAVRTDVPLLGDFDGDHKLDLAVYRPSTGQWIILQSSAGPRVVTFGIPGVDIPVPADYDGDGKTDLAVYRPTTGQWIILRSSAGPEIVSFGLPNVDRPVPADYDGDGKADIAVYRPTTGQWFLLQSSAGLKVTTFGVPGLDIPIPADFDGDGKTDLAVYRPTSNQWLILQSSAGLRIATFGDSRTDIPVPADYDGDGKADIAVYRKTTGQWLILQSTAGPRITAFGAANLDVPLPTPLAFRYRGALVRTAAVTRTEAPAVALAPPPVTDLSQGIGSTRRRVSIFST
jgi:hypothetical protein